jgi:hypothetical protein
MPTPFTHLAVVPEILDHPDLPRAAAVDLAAELPAFLLGSVAPDVQTLSGQTREATHFFPVPLDAGPPATARLLAQHPALARPPALPTAQAAFLSGYLAHLVLDQLWVADIFEPVFGPDRPWASFPERLYLHNVLRAHWDAADLARLPPATARQLGAARPEGWLPFVRDQHLHAWRDLVAGQLEPGAARTVEVFAERMNIDPRVLAGLLASPDEMQRRLFVHLAPGALERYRVSAVGAAAQVLAAYWRGDLAAPRL